MESRGLVFPEEIRRAIERSQRLLLIVSSGTLSSVYVEKEWRHALLHGVVITPILRDGNYDCVPAPLRTLHCVDCRPTIAQDAALAEVLRIVRTPTAPMGSMIGHVPRVPSPFHGRATETDRLRKRLVHDWSLKTSDGPDSRITVVTGMAGIGKSLLVAATVQMPEVRRSFPDGIYWMDLHHDSDALGALRRIGLALGDQSAETYSTVIEARAKLANVIATRRCLIVLDNIWDTGLLESMNSSGTTGVHVVATAQLRQIFASTGAVEINLIPLEYVDSLGLLASWAGIAREELPSAAKDLARECHGLPLALSIIGAMLRVRDGSAAADASKYESILTALRAGSTSVAQRMPNYEHASVDRALLVGYRALTELDQARFIDLCVFPADAVPIAVVRLWWQDIGLPNEETDLVLMRLFDRSLIQLQDGGTLRLHDMQRSFLLRQCEAVHGLHARLISSLARVVGGEHGDMQSTSVGGDDTLHAYARQHLVYHLRNSGLPPEPAHLLWIVNPGIRATVDLRQRGTPQRELRSLYEYGLDTGTRLVMQITKTSSIKAGLALVEIGLGLSSMRASFFGSSYFLPTICGREGILTTTAAPFSRFCGEVESAMAQMAQDVAPDRTHHLIGDADYSCAMISIIGLNRPDPEVARWIIASLTTCVDRDDVTHALLSAPDHRVDMSVPEIAQYLYLMPSGGDREYVLRGVATGAGGERDDRSSVVDPRRLEEVSMSRAQSLHAQFEGLRYRRDRAELLMELLATGEHHVSCDVGGYPFRVLEKALSAIPSPADEGDFLSARVALRLQGQEQRLIEDLGEVVDACCTHISDKHWKVVVSDCLKRPSTGVAAFLRRSVLPRVRSQLARAVLMGRLWDDDESWRTALSTYLEGNLLVEAAAFVSALAEKQHRTGLESVASELVENARRDALPRDYSEIVVTLSALLQDPAGQVSDAVQSLEAGDVAPAASAKTSEVDERMEGLAREAQWRYLPAGVYLRAARACMGKKDVAQTLNQQGLARASKMSDGFAFVQYCRNRFDLDPTPGASAPFVGEDAETVSKFALGVSKDWITLAQVTSRVSLKCATWRTELPDLVVLSEQLKRFEFREECRRGLLPHIECANEMYALSCFAFWAARAAAGSRRDVLSVIRNGAGTIRKIAGDTGLSQVDRALVRWSTP